MKRSLHNGEIKKKQQEKKPHNIQQLKSIEQASRTKISKHIWACPSSGNMSKPLLLLPFSLTDGLTGPGATPPSCDPGKTLKVNKVGHKVRRDGRHVNAEGWDARWRFSKRHKLLRNNAPVQCQDCSGGKCYVARAVSISSWGPRVFKRLNASNVLSKSQFCSFFTKLLKNLKNQQTLNYPVNTEWILFSSVLLAWREDARKCYHALLQDRIYFIISKPPICVFRKSSWFPQI